MLSNIELAKAKFALHSPEFVSLMCKLEFVAKPGLGTAGTDGRRLFYDPDWVDTLTLSETIGLIAHEIGHNMLAHPARIGTRDKRVANIAMDIVLNQTLQTYFDEVRNTLNPKFPPNGLYGPQFDKYKGWNWEKVYADLMENATKLPQFDHVEPGTNEDGTQMSEAEADALAKEWTMAAQQAATMAKQRGKQSGFFESFVSGLVQTKVDWRAQLWDVFTKTAKDDQSFRKFNRRFVSSEVYLPGMYSERIGSVGFFTDTSGSMHDGLFKIALGAVNEIMQDTKPDRIVFGCCDTKMQSVEELTVDDLPVVSHAFKGRGGTVLTPIFEYVKGLDEALELVVCLTDGDCETVDKKLEPGCPVVWLVTSNSTKACEESFGKVIRVEE